MKRFFAVGLCWFGFSLAAELHVRGNEAMESDLGGEGRAVFLHRSLASDAGKEIERMKKL